MCFRFYNRILFFVIRLENKRLVHVKYFDRVCWTVWTTTKNLQMASFICKYVGVCMYVWHINKFKSQKSLQYTLYPKFVVCGKTTWYPLNIRASSHWSSLLAYVSFFAQRIIIITDLFMTFDQKWNPRCDDMGVKEKKDKLYLISSVLYIYIYICI